MNNPKFPKPGQEYEAVDDIVTSLLGSANSVYPLKRTEGSDNPDEEGEAYHRDKEFEEKRQKQKAAREQQKKTSFVTRNFRDYMDEHD